MHFGKLCVILDLEKRKGEIIMAELPNGFYFKVRGMNNEHWAGKVGPRFYVKFSDGSVNTRTEDYVRNAVRTGKWTILHDKKTDEIESPSHYQGKFEVIEIIEQLTEGMEGSKAYKLGNVIKYIFRHEKKGGITDLKKAKRYLDWVIEEGDD